MNSPQSDLKWKPQTLPVSLFGLAFCGFAIVVFALDSRRHILDWCVLVAYCALFLLAIWGLVYSVRTRIEGDAEGVRWRDWRGVWRAARWDEIEDFSGEQRKKIWKYRVEAAHGQFDFDDGDDGEALAARIAANAVNAPARQWERKGERLCDQWPRHFDYWTPRLVWAPWAVLLVGTVLVGWASLGFRAAPREAELPLSTWVLAYVGPLILVALLPVFLFIVSLWASRRARPWRGFSLEIAPTGLVYHGPTRVTARWARIESWGWHRRGRTRVLRAQTADGVIEIPTFIDGFSTIHRLLEKWGGVELGAIDELELATTPLQTAPDGTLIFRFNSMVVRLFMAVFISCAAMMLALPWLFELADPQKAPDNELMQIGVFFLLMAVALWIGTSLSSLHVSRDALEWRWLWRRRRIAWGAIESLNDNAKGVWLVASGRKVSLFWTMGLVGQPSRLRAEIEARALNASGGWKADEAE